MAHRLPKFHRHSSLANGHGRAGVLVLSLKNKTHTHTQGKRGEENTREERTREERERGGEERETKLVVGPGKGGALRSDAPLVHVSFYNFVVFGSGCLC